ncbi:hypothetical protein KC19_3G027200 [Ceratodon purpureus]|uniref:Uncharacterized protein n=1 Tax=Ceratodon purpureus TaxID=3225 RepID=A0A8T0IGI6_CERPU|nr:hypothetical protein KC19_3G027200 [Ceratodon purpureus]
MRRLLGTSVWLVIKFLPLACFNIRKVEGLRLSGFCNFELLTTRTYVLVLRE